MLGVWAWFLGWIGVWSGWGGSCLAQWVHPLRGVVGFSSGYRGMLVGFDAIVLGFGFGVIRLCRVGWSGNVCF